MDAFLKDSTVTISQKFFFSVIRRYRMLYFIINLYKTHMRYYVTKILLQHYQIPTMW